MAPRSKSKEELSYEHIHRIEARVSALERRQAQTDARFEEVTEDMATGFKQISGDITASFDQFTQYLDKSEKLNEERLKKIENRLNKIETDITEIKTTIATTNQSTLHLLTQILERLPNS